MAEAGRTARRGARRLRAPILTVLVALALAATAVIAYRVLAPTEVVTPARADYPQPPAAAPGVVGRLSVAPLLVDGRLRLYAAERQVRVDGPVDAEAQLTPYWSYRRWPQRLVGVAASGTTVISRWSDGVLVAIDAPTGRPRWRAAGPSPSTRDYLGRRTGAATVYTPPGLHTATAPDGRATVIVEGVGGVRGYDPRTGEERWRVDGDCERDGFTTATGWYVTVDTCAATLRFRDAATGQLLRDWRPTQPGIAAEQIEPVGCLVARSGCRALRAGGERGWLFDPPGPTAAPGLTPDSWLVDELAVTFDADQATVTARGVRDGRTRWRVTVPGARGARLIAAQPGRVHLLTVARELVTVDAATGAERSRFVLRTGREKTNWAPGFAYAAEGYVAVERLWEPVNPRAKDDRYYRSAEPVIFAAT